MISAPESVESTRVAMFVNQPMCFDPGQNRYSANYMNLIDFLFKASRVFKEMTLCLPVGEGTGSVPLNLPDNVRILHLPYYNGPRDLLCSAYRVIPRLLEAVRSDQFRNADIVGAVVPSTLGAVTVPISYYWYRKPHFLLMRGDKRATVSRLVEDDFVGKLLIQPPIRLYDLFFSSISSKKNVSLITIGDLRERITEYGYTADNVSVITPLIPANLLRGEPAINDSVTNILYVGRLSDEKGVDDLVRAFIELGGQSSSITLHIVGSGPTSEDLVSLVRRFGLEDSIVFHGFVPKGPELWKHFERADLFVLPSYTEGLPRVVGEAMAIGTPVIATAVGGVPQLIKDGENGLLVKPGDITALAEAMEHLVKSRETRAQFVVNGLETAKNLTFTEATKQLRGVLVKELLG